MAIGLFASLGATRLMRGLLYEVRPTDPLTLAFVCGVLSRISRPGRR